MNRQPDAAGDPPRAVAVVGLGLIGGSLCRALRRNLPGVRITGIDVDPRATGLARADGACDISGTSAELLSGAEVIVLATPLDAIPEWFPLCTAHAPAAVVTDCGSTKAWIVERARDVPGLMFLGGHPMAGREQGGYQGSDGRLFDGSTWVLTPDGDHPMEAFSPWRRALHAIGARVEIMSPDDHDRAAAWASHLPLAVSSALARTAAASTEWPVARLLTAGGFRDGTRLAGGDPRLHSTIALTNARALGAALDAFLGDLTELRDSLNDQGRVRDYFDAAREARREWGDHRTRSEPPIQ